MDIKVENIVLLMDGTVQKEMIGVLVQQNVLINIHHVMNLHGNGMGIK